jgi:GTP 3',8-cyclase
VTASDPAFGGRSRDRLAARERVAILRASCYHPPRPMPHVPAPGEPVLAYVLGDALYLNLTSACTLACTFCPKIRDGDWSVGGYDLRLARNPTADEVWEAATRVGVDGRTEVVFTGLGEPTRRLDVLLDLVRRLEARGVPRVRVDTDGLATLREGRDVAALLGAAGLEAISVSLNAPDAETYARLCPSRHGVLAYEAVKAFIRSCVGVIPDVAASAVALPELSEAECRRVAGALGARFRWRPYDRLGRLEESDPHG